MTSDPRPKRAKMLRALGWPVRALENLGEQGVFYVRAIGWSQKTVRRYRKEVLRLISEISMGTGALAVIGGTVMVVVFILASAGAIVGTQGYYTLSSLKLEVLNGFFSAYVHTRVAGPAITGVALSATVGAGITAELGAKRISEEIDALEVMAVPSVPFLVTTRMLAAFLAIVPLYAIGVVSAFAFNKFTVVYVFGLSGGSYDHYFDSFLIPSDLLWSFFQAIVMAIAVTLVHTYYGYTASGGPAGVGLAVSKSVRVSIVLVITVVLLTSMGVFGPRDTFRISG
jgi:phospholipid/cholesterol/gamma-HCH transport system permease protein